MKRSAPFTDCFRQGLIILLAAVVPVYHGQYQGCPHDVAYSTQQCWSQYDTLLNTLFLPNQYFYSGLDIESIRLICQQLTVGMQCAGRYKNACPASEYSNIEVIFRQYASVFHLCNYDNLYEVYARNQRQCFSRLSPSSEMCRNTFLVNSEPYTRAATQQHQGAMNAYCSVVEDFVECVETKVKVNCAPDAVPLVAPLVYASVDLSEYCTEAGQSQPSTPSPNSGSKSTQSQRSANGQVSGSTRIHLNTNLYWIFTLSLLWAGLSLLSPSLSSH